MILVASGHQAVRLLVGDGGGMPKWYTVVYESCLGPRLIVIIFVVIITMINMITIITIIIIIIIYIYIYICMCIYIYIYIHIHTSHRGALPRSDPGSGLACSRRVS